MSDIRIDLLSSLVHFKNGKAIKKSDGKIPIYGGNGILGYTKETNFKNTLIIGRVGAYCGSVHIEKGPCWVSDNAIAGVPRSIESNEYNYYLLKSLKLNEQRIGSSQPLLTQGILNSIQVRIEHDLVQQQKIAKVLSTIDAKIELNNKINAELEAMAKLLYDYWFVQFEFPDENGKPYKSSGGKMVFNEVLKREIPVGWSGIKLGDVDGEIITGKTPPKTHPHYFNGTVPFVTIGDIRGHMHVIETEETLSKEGAEYQKNKYIKEGDICVTCIATIGLVAFASTASQTNQQINTISCNNSSDRTYLYFAISDFFKMSKAKTGNTFANMNKADFSEIKILNANIDILKNFSAMVDPIIEKNLKNERESLALTQLRDYLLPMLMNGQITVK